MLQLTRKEEQELAKLHRLWACKRATSKQIQRAMELDKKVDAYRAALAKARDLFIDVHGRLCRGVEK